MPKTFSGRIKNKNDTSENWTLFDPILLKGEIGIEIDTNRFKVGNGIDKWSLLDYCGNIVDYIVNQNSFNKFEIWIGTQDEYLNVEDELNVLYLIE